MAAASFAWRLISDESAWSGRSHGSLDERHLLQLKGIFLHHDEDRDGYLTTAQLSDALASIGFKTRDKLLLKFCAQTKSMSGTFKTDFKTFAAVISREIAMLQQLDGELTDLFSLMDSSGSGCLSRKDLRHLLTEVHTSSPLGAGDFTKFMKSLRFSSDNDKIGIEELKRQLLFQY